MKAMAKADVGEGGKHDLKDVAKGFKHWRESRVRGERIPVFLWGEAVQMCQQHTPQRVASELRLSLASLMRRLKLGGDRVGARPEFVEVLRSTALGAADYTASRLESVLAAKSPPPRAPVTAPANECVLELENVRGAKMRVQLNGAGLVSLEPLLSSFWDAA